MATISNFNVYPFFDDYNEDKNFLKILFRPGVSVQMRELNQLQTILQKQIDRFGRHMFKEGSMILPGAVSYDVNQNFAKLNDLNNNSNAIVAEWFTGATVTCVASGVVGKVMDFVDSDGTDPKTIYIQYVGATTSTTSFQPNDILTITASPNPNYIGLTAVVQSAADSVGIGSAAFVDEGVYFTQGYFVKVLKQKIYLSKYTNFDLSFRVGLSVDQSIVNESDDPSLLSNASGEPNYLAPGALRFQISLNLTKIDVQPEEDPRTPTNVQNFLELLVIKNDIVYKQVLYTEYNVLEKTLARRTFDESGDYSVKPFVATVRDYLDTGTNNGLYKKSILVDKNLSILPGDTITENDNLASGTVSLYNHVTGRLFFVQTTAVDFDASTPKIITVTRGIITFTTTMTAVYGNDYVDMFGLVVEPGKAYVKGHEIEKVAKEVVAVNRARTTKAFNDIVCDVTHGNVVYVKNLSAGIPDIFNFQSCDIHNVIAADVVGSTTKIGSCRIKFIQYESGIIGTASGIDDLNSNYAKYFLYIFDVQMLNGKNFEDAQSFFSTNFKCDIITDLYKMSGLVTGDHTISDPPSGTYNLSGDQNCKFTRDLHVDDIVIVHPSGDSTQRIKIKILSVVSDFSATYTIISHTIAPAPLIGKDEFFVQFASLDAPINNLLVYRLPHNNIKDLFDFNGIAPSGLDVKFSVLRTNIGLVSAGSPAYIDLSVSGTGESLSTNTKDYMAFDGSSFVEPTSILMIDIVNRNHVHVFLPAGTYDLIFLVNRTAASAGFRAKTNHTNGVFTITDSATLSQDTIRIDNFLDVYQIKHIWMDKDFTGTFLPAEITDIAGRYVLDSGQRDNYYDYANIIRKKNSPLPTGALRIEFNYFEHDAATKNMCYYCANSYNQAYDIIPEYVTTDGTHFQLRDSIDFRPDITEIDNPTAAIELLIPVWGFVTDYEIYLNRKDKLVLTDDGTFQVVSGVPNINPISPETPGNAMNLYDISIAAYTAHNSDVILGFVDNKRYTMRMIGDLEDRIANVEYYTTLSLLEKQTADMQFRDPDTNLDRYKLGFIVDSFAVPLSDDSTVSDVNNIDSRCSIDVENTECRPQFNQKQVKFELNPVNQVNIQPLLTSGDIITLAYQEVDFIKQDIATYTENVNPFNISSFYGTVLLNPPFDDWKETKTIDADRVNVEGDFNSLQELTQQMGTKWNDWETNWSGKTKTKTTSTKKQQVGFELQDKSVLYFSDLHFDNKGQPLSLSKLSAYDRNKVELARAKFFSNEFVAPVYTQRFTETKTSSTTTTKSGVRFGVTESIVTKDLGEKIVSVDYVPFIRSRLVQFTANRMRPNTEVYAFFDGKPVSDFCGQTNVQDTQINGIYHVVPGSLVTDSTGSLVGYFEIPNNDLLKFQTGERKFRLTSSKDNLPAIGENPSLAETTYRASGIEETKQDTILSIRNAEIVSTPVSETDTQTLTDVNKYTKQTFGAWEDPIAQTFYVDSVGGAFITSVEIFFATKSSNIPVEVQIREVTADQRPSSDKIVPFSRVVKQSAAVTTTSDASVSTKFTFESPVYLMDKTVYALCVLSDSDDYTVFVANLTPPTPEDSVAKNVIISPSDLAGQIYTQSQYKQYLGVFFKSQNGGTWSDNQLIDLKFKINKAQFNIDQIGSFEMLDGSEPNDYWETLPPNCFKVQSLSDKLRVFHPNHGYKSGKVVDIRITDSNSLQYWDTGTSAYFPIGTTLTGVTIVSAETDFYVVQSPIPNYKFSLAGKKEYSGYVNDSFARATANKKVDVLRTMIGELNFNSDTSTAYQVSTIPFADDNAQISIIDILPNTNIEFDKSAIVYNVENRRGAPLNPIPSMIITIALQSSNANVSPVIDLKRFSAVAVANRIDNPDYSINRQDIDYVTVIGSGDAFTAVYNISDSSITLSKTGVTEDKMTQLYNILTSGKFIDINTDIILVDRGRMITSRVLTLSGGTSTLKLYVDTMITPPSVLTVTNCVLTLHDYFIDEIAAQGGSCSAKYVTKRMSLANSATALKVIFPGYYNLANTYDLYVKTLGVGDNRDMDDIEYVQYLPDNNPKASMADDQAYEFTYTINGLTPFTAVAAKIVMRGASLNSGDKTGSAKAHRILDFRMIALE